MAIPAIASAASSSGAATGTAAASSSSASSAALASGISAGSGIIGSLVQAPFAKKRQERNFEYAKKLQQQEYENNIKAADYNQQIYEKNQQALWDREDFLNANSKKIEVDALRNAGLNPAWSQSGAGQLTAGSVASGGSAQGASANYQDYGDNGSQAAIKGIFDSLSAFPMTYLQALQMKESADLTAATADKTKAEADNIKREGARQEDEDNISHWVPESHMFEKDGVIYVKFGDDYIKADEFPKTKRGLEALSSFHKMDRDNNIYQSEATKAALDNMVSKLQLNDPKTLMALSLMPEELYRSICTKNNLQDIEYEIKRDSNFFQELNKLGDSDISSFVKFLASAFLTFR